MVGLYGNSTNFDALVKSILMALFLWARCCNSLAGVVELENSLNPTENRKTIPALEIFI